MTGPPSPAAWTEFRHGPRDPLAEDAPRDIYFYSFDCNEPVHVHVERDQLKCKLWLGLRGPREQQWIQLDRVETDPCSDPGARIEDQEGVE
jgi:hypothetical protein